MQPKRGPGITELRSAFLLIKTIKWENWPVRREEGKKKFYHQSSKYACSQSGSRDKQNSVRLAFRNGSSGINNLPAFPSPRPLLAKISYI